MSKGNIVPIRTKVACFQGTYRFTRNPFPSHGQQDSLTTMHVLLTGASGFFGGVCAELLAQQKDAHVYILRSGERAEEVSSTARVLSAPRSLLAADLARSLGDTPITHILHVGALASPEACERNPQSAWTSNVDFTRMLSDYSRSTNAHLTTISTDLVFDGRTAPPEGFREEDPPSPHSVYSRSKLAAEEATVREASGAVVRVALLYGDSPSQSKGFLGWMKRAFEAREPVPLFLDEYRTPTHVRDAAQAAIEVSRRALRGVWHCGGPERMSRVEFGKRVAHAYGFEETLIRTTTRLSYTILPPRPEDVSLNSTALWSALGFKPKTVAEALHCYERP